MFKPWAAMSLCFALIFPMTQATVHAHAHASTCKVLGGQSGSLNHSGQLNAISAKVCGNEIWKLLPKPKKPAKKKPATSSGRKISWKNEFVVSPKTPSFTRSNTQVLDVDEVIDLSSLAKAHILNRLLLWYPAQVRFTPVEHFWTFGDGTDSQSALVAHSWSRSGTYSIKLTVSYSVKYRIIGKSGWVVLPGRVTAKAVPQIVKVGQSEVTKPKVVLVHWNCLQRIQAAGC